MKDIRTDSVEEEINQALRTSHLVTLEISACKSSMERQWICLILPSKSSLPLIEGCALKSRDLPASCCFIKVNKKS